MTDETQAEKLTARMERMKPSEAIKRRRGINPYALSTITAVAGVGVGAWLVLAAPDAPTPAPAIETASVSDFQGNGTGTDGSAFRGQSRRLSRQHQTPRRQNGCRPRSRR